MQKRVKLKRGRRTHEARVVEDGEQREKERGDEERDEQMAERVRERRQPVRRGRRRREQCAHRVQRVCDCNAVQCRAVDETGHRVRVEADRPQPEAEFEACAMLC